MGVELDSGKAEDNFVVKIKSARLPAAKRGVLKIGYTWNRVRGWITGCHIMQRDSGLQPDHDHLDCWQLLIFFWWPGAPLSVLDASNTTFQEEEPIRLGGI